MKKALLIGLIVILVLAILATAFVLLYRHFVTDRIMDRGGMENPFLDSDWDEVPEVASEASADSAAEEAKTP